MKIVGWAEFSAMPPGTVFQMTNDRRPDWSDLRILHEVWKYEDGRGDFVEASLMPTIIHDAHMMTDANQATFTPEQTRSGMFTMHPDLLCRDGMIEFDRQWLIWEREDLERLAGWLIDPMKGLQAIGYRIGEIALPMPETSRAAS
ncbi:hypothetical protein ASG63_16360 [Methylobacterium sp. Leaf94]|uniref:hypothetical protein n=1 Tax=Methylobacterium sp. Leaf94 TaxID=1736250 RepID=UPI0006FD021D|nr:hypothetical protein [Methylobacterium sp. Leaf94]KQU31071.1 hypothetical protein ASG63_16360 [Methylobacterium sp. Leaf94]